MSINDLEVVDLGGFPEFLVSITGILYLFQNVYHWYKCSRNKTLMISDSAGAFYKWRQSTEFLHGISVLSRFMQTMLIF